MDNGIYFKYAAKTEIQMGLNDISQHLNSEFLILPIALGG